MDVLGPATLIDFRLEIGRRPPKDGCEYQDWLDGMEIFPDQPTCSGIPRAMHEKSRCLFFNRWDQYANQILQLPCGCHWRRACTPYMYWKWHNKDEVRCKACNSVIFNSVAWRWMNENAKTTGIEGLEEKHKMCVICREDYTSTPSTPIAILPCTHAHHHPCLETWLSTSPNCGRGNTCPTCRHILFTPPPSLFSETTISETDPLDERLPVEFHYTDGTTRVLEGLDLAAEDGKVMEIAEVHWQCRLRVMEGYRQEWLDALVSESNIFG